MRRKSLGGVALGGLVAGASAWWGPALSVPVPPVGRLLGAHTHVPSPGVAITFDDGPHPRGTPAVLAALSDRGVPATFFVAGEQAERRAALVAEIVAAGHEVGVHCHRHLSPLRLSPAALARDLDRAAAAVAAAAGRAPRLVRPPYGHLTLAGLAEARRRRWEVLLWSAHGRDWGRRSDPASVAARLGARLARGAVVLLHDADFYGTPGSWRATAAAVPRLLEAMDEAGLRAVAVPPLSS